METGPPIPSPKKYNQGINRETIWHITLGKKEEVHPGEEDITNLGMNLIPGKRPFPSNEPKKLNSQMKKSSNVKLLKITKGYPCRPDITDGTIIHRHYEELKNRGNIAISSTKWFTILQKD